MKKITTSILFLAVLFGLAATSCQTKHSCPAYGKASLAKSRRV